MKPTKINQEKLATWVANAKTETEKVYLKQYLKGEREYHVVDHMVAEQLPEYKRRFLMEECTNVKKKL